MENKYQHIAVIDIGKTNAKLVLIDAQSSQQLNILSCPNTVLQDGIYPHLDVDNIWQFITAGLKQFHAQHGLDAISITTHGATAVLMTDDELTLPVLDYESSLPDQTQAEYLTARGQFSETFSPKLPGGLNIGAQIFWQQKTFPTKFNTVTDILMYPQFWAWKLTGKKATEVTSLGVHTDLWNPLKKDFSKLVDGKKWRTLFPPLAAARSILGNLHDNIRLEIGAKTAIPVACGIHDSNASLLPYLTKPDAKITVISSGTWTIVMSIGGNVTGLDETRDSLANVDAYGNIVPTARFMGGREYDILVGDRQAQATDADVDNIIGQQIYITPTFSGKVGPFPHHKGAWVGPFEAITDQQHCAAIGLYLALMSYECIKLAGCGNVVIIEGPFTKNPAYAAILSALLNRPVYLSTDATGTSTGATLLLNSHRSTIDLGKPVKPYAGKSLAAYAQTWLGLINKNKKKY
ncbi:MAG: carbohydrate kinase [Rhizobiales bacterium]|nr:FGGY family carbohydrate kinase [Hyphomicrobiales bacterium]NRB15615.1 carbohydrate kinase [Hyphomicrobiales bacterium]